MKVQLLLKDYFYDGNEPVLTTAGSGKARHCAYLKMIINMWISSRLFFLSQKLFWRKFTGFQDIKWAGSTESDVIFGGCFLFFLFFLEKMHPSKVCAAPLSSLGVGWGVGGVGNGVGHLFL